MIRHLQTARLPASPSASLSGPMTCPMGCPMTRLGPRHLGHGPARPRLHSSF